MGPLCEQEARLMPRLVGKGRRRVPWSPESWLDRQQAWPGPLSGRRGSARAWLRDVTAFGTAQEQLNGGRLAPRQATS